MCVLFVVTKFVALLYDKTANIQTNYGPEIFEIGSKLTELQPFEIRNFDLGHPVHI